MCSHSINARTSDRAWALTDCSMLHGIELAEDGYDKGISALVTRGTSQVPWRLQRVRRPSFGFTCWGRLPADRRLSHTRPNWELLPSMAP